MDIGTPFRGAISPRVLRKPQGIQALPRTALLHSQYRPVSPLHRRNTQRLLNRKVRQPHRRRSTNSIRSEEHTSELQLRFDYVCRLLLVKKKRQTQLEYANPTTL